MKHDNIKTLTGAEMRALRDQRLAAQTGPAVEARRREAAVIKNLSTARDDLLWIRDNEAWRYLGFDSGTDWYEARIYPIMRSLDARPQPEVAALVVKQAIADNKALPPAQRRSQREIADVAMVSRSTVARQVRQDPPTVPSAPYDDLAVAPEQAAKMPINHSAPRQRTPEPIEPERCPTCRQPLPSASQSDLTLG